MSVAQLVEHYLAKVDVESSNLFTHSILLKVSENVGDLLYAIEGLSTDDRYALNSNWAGWYLEVWGERVILLLRYT